MTTKTPLTPEQKVLKKVNKILRKQKENQTTLYAIENRIDQLEYNTCPTSPRLKIRGRDVIIIISVACLIATTVKYVFF